MNDVVVYFNQTVPQVFISGIAVSEPPEVPYDATLKALICQKVPQHM